MPRVRLAFLADAAIAHPEGKVYVIGGGVDTLIVREFPAVQGALALVIKVEFTPGESGRKHLIEVLTLDSDGNPLLPTAKFEVTPERNPDAPTLPTAVQIVINFQNFVIPKEGEYAFSVLVNGNELDSVALRAVKQKAPA